MRDLEGVLIPVPTPYRGDAVAPDRLRANLERWNQMGVSGYVVLGSTGEFPMLSDAERDVVLAAARSGIAPGKAFVAGTGSQSTQHTIRQTRRAAYLGADLALVITPHYFTKAFSDASSQVRHYLAVAEAAPIPVVLYNVPGSTGINMDPDTIARIALHPNVCGIDDASGDMQQAAQTIHLTPKTFAVLVGTAAALLPSLAIGSAGGILGLAAVAARELVDVYTLARQGRWEEAKELAARVMRADRGVVSRYGFGGLRGGGDEVGLVGGSCGWTLPNQDGDGIE